MTAKKENNRFCLMGVYKGAWLYFADTVLFAIYKEGNPVGFVSMYVGEKHFKKMNGR